MSRKKRIQNKIRVIPLGGLEEIGRNMMLIEYERNILIIDMGLQFPEEDMPGIDYIIPNIEYLKGKEDHILGIIFTHGHYDHIGAIPYLIEKLRYPPIYAAPLTRGIILKRQEDFPNLKALEIHEIRQDTKLKLGVFMVEFFHVNHNIFDTMGVALKTPVGTIVHTADFKFDNNPIGDKPADYGKMSRIGESGVLLLMSDSTGVEKPGYSISEKTILDNLEEIFRKSESRIIVATFASLITRIQQIIELSQKYGRKLVVDGYSIKTNLEIANKLGYIKIVKGTLIETKDVNKYHPSKITILCTGAQGEGGAALMRIVNKEHRFISIRKDDTFIFSSSVIPGNERTVQDVKDRIYRQGGRVIHYGMMDIHASGHAHREDMKMMINFMKPSFFMPIHGNHFMLVQHGELARQLGIPPKNVVVPLNGQVINLTNSYINVTRECVPTNYIMVDGLGVGDVGNVVLRDRQMMAEDGIFVIISIVDSKTGKLKMSPDIISRGFVYLKESKELLGEVRKKVKQIVDETSSPEHATNWVYVKDNLRDRIGQFLYSKTKRRPMVIPVVIEI